MHFLVAILCLSYMVLERRSHEALKRSESVTVKSREHCSIIGKSLCRKHKINFIILWCQECECQSEVRFSVWGKQTGKKLTSTPKLESLPPTTEVFLLDVLRAHYQASIWNSCLQPRPPKMDPCQVKCLVIESWSVLFFYLIF